METRQKEKIVKKSLLENRQKQIMQLWRNGRTSKKGEKQKMENWQAKKKYRILENWH